MNIKVTIADDHPIVVEGLYKLLETVPQIEVVGTYGSGSSLLEGIKETSPDVLLLDLHFPDVHGKELASIISQQYPQIRILILSSVDNPYEVREVMEKGCAGYLQKNVQPTILVEAIKQVYAGQTYIEPSMKEQLLHSLFSPKKETLKLTQREKDILKLVAAGKTSVEIAEQLFLSYRTIQNNRATLYEKFGVHNTAELMKVALQLGYVDS